MAVERKTPTAPCARSRFEDADYLRIVLIRMHNTGSIGANHPAMRELCEHINDRFRPLTRKLGLDAADAASAAWEQMRQPSICTATDPWGTLTKAVTTTLRSWAFAEENLCSTEAARRGDVAGFFVERISERENEVWEYHPAFAVTDQPHEADDPFTRRAGELAPLFVQLGWPTRTGAAIETILYRLADIGDRPRTYEAMRRDDHLQSLLGISGEPWRFLLRTLLGNPADPLSASEAGQGILLRRELGASMGELWADDELTLAILTNAPAMQQRQPESGDAQTRGNGAKAELLVAA